MRADEELDQVKRAYFDASRVGHRSWARLRAGQHDELRVLGTRADEFFAGAFADEVMMSGDAHLQAPVSINAAASSEGAGGWGMARVRWSLPDAGVLIARWSDLFRRGPYGWKVFQIHTSRPGG